MASVTAPRRRHPRTASACVATVAVMLLAGCAATDPHGYDTFDEWLVGDTEVYQLDKRAELRPQVYRMLYGPVLTVPLLPYDAGRIVASPFTWTYYTASALGRSDGPRRDDGEPNSP